jgi:hypothetical protein
MENSELQLLINLISKKIQTTMIGSLSRFETGFGHLWAHHKKHEEELTDQELYFDNIWQDVRNNILNHGNNQIRLATEDIRKAITNEPSIKYNYTFKTKGDNR